MAVEMVWQCRNVKRNDNVKYENDDEIIFTSKPKVKIKSGELITLCITRTCYLQNIYSFNAYF